MRISTPTKMQKFSHINLNSQKQKLGLKEPKMSRSNKTQLSIPSNGCCSINSLHLVTLFGSDLILFISFTIKIVRVRKKCQIAGSIGFQYAAEMLPSVVRAQGVSLIHIIGYVAHIIGPYVVYLADISIELPLIVLGLLSVIVAVQALLMPETLGQDLPQTLQDGNDFGREQRFWWFPCVSR